MSDSDNLSPVILFVDDEATAVKYFQRAIGSLASVATAGSVDDGKRMLDAHVDTLKVLVSDQRMPGAYGNELLEYAKDRYPDIVRILTTAYSELENTVEAVNQGQIHRYIQKPWEITALRMELKQALEMANLRSDHTQLLREKLMVRHRQLIANRIGTLYALCASLSEPGNVIPVDAYLSAAMTAGVTAPEADWLTMDHSDLVSAEAFRNGKFGHAVIGALSEIRQRYPHGGEQKALDVLVAWMDDDVKPVDEGSVVLTNERVLAEFLETPPAAVVSPQHVRWLAFLLWLDGSKSSLQVTRSDSGLQCSLAKPEAPVSALRLANWIEQF
jgi:two-component system probable response regulator PhcQ